MAARQVIALSAVIALNAAACFDPPDVDQGLHCDPDGNLCPDGQYCADDGYCYWEGSSICDRPLRCESPEDDSNAICGQIYDIETHTELRDPDAEGLVCQAGGDPVPCKLMVTLHDPVEWAANPDARPALDVASITVDDCGRFAATGIQHPASDFIAIVLDDPGDDYVATARTVNLGPGEVDYSTYAVATARKTDEQWTNTAEDPFDGATFSERGAHLAVYYHHYEPAEDVIARVRDQTRTESDYYFANDDPELRATIEPTATATTSNGAALILDEGWAEYSGMGGLPDGCAWSKTRHLTLPGLISYGEYFSRLDDYSNDCP